MHSRSPLEIVGSERLLSAQIEIFNPEILKLSLDLCLGIGDQSAMEPIREQGGESANVIERSSHTYWRSGWDLRRDEALALPSADKMGVQEALKTLKALEFRLFPDSAELQGLKPCSVSQTKLICAARSILHGTQRDFKSMWSTIENVLGDYLSTTAKAGSLDAAIHSMGADWPIGRRTWAFFGQVSGISDVAEFSAALDQAFLRPDGSTLQDVLFPEFARALIAGLPKALRDAHQDDAERWTHTRANQLAKKQVRRSPPAIQHSDQLDPDFIRSRDERAAEHRERLRRCLLPEERMHWTPRRLPAVSHTPTPPHDGSRHVSPAELMARLELTGSLVSPHTAQSSGARRLLSGNDTDFRFRAAVAAARIIIWHPDATQSRGDLAQRGPRFSSTYRAALRVADPQYYGGQAVIPKSERNIFDRRVNRDAGAACLLLLVSAREAAAVFRRELEDFSDLGLSTPETGDREEQSDEDATSSYLHDCAKALRYITGVERHAMLAFLEIARVNLKELIGVGGVEKSRVYLNWATACFASLTEALKAEPIAKSDDLKDICDLCHDFSKEVIDAMPGKLTLDITTEVSPVRNVLAGFLSKLSMQRSGTAAAGVRTIPELLASTHDGKSRERTFYAISNALELAVTLLDTVPTMGHLVDKKASAALTALYDASKEIIEHMQIVSLRKQNFFTPGGNGEWEWSELSADILLDKLDLIADLVEQLDDWRSSQQSAQ